MKGKKIVFSDSWKVEVQSEEMDENLVKAHEVIVKTMYSLISAGTELACLEGKEASWFKFPKVPGYSAVGQIIACGSDVTDFRVKDVIFYYGSHSAYSKLDTKNEFCAKLPEGVDARYATFTRMATIAMTALRTSDIELGDYVGVTGLGIVGNLAAQLAHLQGGKVIGFDLDLERLKVAEQCGILHTVNSCDKDIAAQISVLTKNKGIQTMIEATGVSMAALNSLPMIAQGGEVILLGTPRDEYITDVTQVLRYFHLSGSALKIKPAHEWIYPVKQDPFVKHSFERNTHIVFELIKDGLLKILPLMSHVVKPEEAPSVYEALRNRQKEYVGIVMDWNNE